MLRRFVSAAVGVVAIAGLALAKDYKGVITKIDAEGKKITFKVEGEDKAKTFTYDDDTKFVNAAGKEMKAKGVAKLAEALGDKGAPATITTDDDDKKVTKVTMGKRKKKDE